MFLGKLMKILKRTPIAAAAAVSLATLAAPLADADTLYWSQPNLGTISVTDTAIPSTNTVFTGAVDPDSLIFNSAGTKIIYTVETGPSAGVWMVNLNGTGNTQIATSAQLGGSTNLQDLALSPNGSTVLVSATDKGTLFSIDLSNSNAVSTFQTFAGGANNLRGVTYDGAGDVFAVVGNLVYKIDPSNNVTSTSLGSGITGDGITIDQLGNLYVADTFNDLFLTNTSLSSVIAIPCLNPLSACFNSTYDGIEADVNGNIDIADTTVGQIVQYNPGTGNFIQLAVTPHIDDLAPLVGAGSLQVTNPNPPSAVPEPTSAVLLLAALPLIVWKHRKRAVN
jgi:sugar lactone lactonase YvrE